MIYPIKLNHCPKCNKIILVRNFDDQDFSPYLKELGYKKLSGQFIHEICFKQMYPWLFWDYEENND